MADQRKCIKCGVTQQKLDLGKVEIDCCPQCGGIWLDQTEVRALSEKPQETIDALRGIEESLASKKILRGNHTETPCPACNGKLTIAQFGGNALEHCSLCAGIFLDLGELEKTLELVKEGKATTIMSLAKSVTTSGTIGS